MLFSDVPPTLQGQTPPVGALLTTSQETSYLMIIPIVNSLLFPLCALEEIREVQISCFFIFF